MKSKLLLVTVLAILFGCSSALASKFDEAISLVKNRKADCVLICSDSSLVVEQGRGLSPILRVYDAHTDAMKGATVVDKVVGRAAAMVAINGKASRVYGELISEDAVELLKKHGIEVSYAQLVPRILNRTRDGLCPLEQSVLGIEDPTAALASVRQRVAELSAGNQSKK